MGARASAKAALDAEIVLQQVPVLIKKGMTTAISKSIFPHEFPILEEIHGEGNVEEADDTQYMTIPEPCALTPSDEWARLESFYGQHEKLEMTWVEKVYGSKTRLAMAMKEHAVKPGKELAAA